MSNIATAIREEVTRLARKELKKETAVLKKASAQHRRDIAALKRKVASLLKSNGLLQKKVLAKPVQADADIDPSKVRFSAKGLKSHREKLGLSAADYAKLAGVSSLSIYNWESGKAKPRRNAVETLAALRKVSKREAVVRLEAM